MHTAYRETPVSQFVKVVDNSPAVNRESLFDTAEMSNFGTVAHSRQGFLPTGLQAASLDSTEAVDALREFDEQPFAVTFGGREIMVHPAPPSIPAQIIPAGSLMGLRSEYAIDITPQEYLQ